MLLSAADELWRSVRTYGTGERGEVVVAYGASASYETAPRLLHALAESHPRIAITTAVKSVGEIVAGVSDGSIDLGLVRCPPQNGGLEDRTIRLERQGLLVRRDQRLASRSAISLAELCFDLGYGPILRAEAVAIIGESSRSGLPDELCWLPLVPAATFEVSVLARRHGRSPALDRMLDTATGIADALDWI